MGITPEQIEACEKAATKIAREFPKESGWASGPDNSDRVNSLFNSCIKRATEPETIPDGWIYAHPVMTFFLTLSAIVVVYYIAKMIILRKNNAK